MEIMDKDFLDAYNEKNSDEQEWKKNLINDLTDMDYYDILEVQGRSLENKTKILLRDDV